MNKMELLAPAGNFESLYAAINAGCDAVYLGLDDFNARIKAENFNTTNIYDVVRYAHLRDVKVYVTLNIIIKDDEYSSLLRMIKETIKANVDAYIIQDLGVASFLKSHFPNICLHASTQMGIHNVQGAQVAKELGFTRIVLSRETKLEDIKEIKEKTNLEIEYFIQGALCVSFSGNCYLSSFKTLNSGNRGRCQQLCRLKYQAFNGDTFINSGYLISPRDLSLIKNISLLKEAGVDSLKIEGRLRRKGYVATTVSTYRKVLDIFENENINKNISYDEEILKLKKVFSRGDFLYDAYLKDENTSNVINKDVQNHLGIKVGKSISCKQFKDIYEIEVYSTHPLVKGDGLKFFKDGKEVASLGVGNVINLPTGNYKIFSKNKVPNGTDMYLTLDYALEESNLNLVKKLPIDIYCYAYSSSPLVVTINYKDLSITTYSSYIIQEASNAPVSKENIKEQLNKLSDTSFVSNIIEVECDNCFIPKSIINETRRNAIKELEDLMLSKYENNIEEVDTNPLYSYETYHKDMVIVNEHIKLNTLKKFDLNDKLIVFSFSNYSQAKTYIEYIKSEYSNNDFAINMPIIITNKDLNIIDELIKKYDLIVIANNIGHLSYIKTNKVIAGLGLNICSTRTRDFYLSLGCVNIIWSLEAPKLLTLMDYNNYYYAIGYNTLMNFAHCPYKVNYGNTCNKCSFNDNLLYQDDNHNKMAIRRIKMHYCYFELLNSHLINSYNDINGRTIVDLRNMNEETINNVSLLLNGEDVELSNKETKGSNVKEIK